MRILEVQHVETPTVKWAKKNGILSRKMNGAGARSWPDRLFILPDGKVFFIEFKAPKKRLEHLQYEMLKSLLALDQDVEVHDDKEEAIAALYTRLKVGAVDSTPIHERFLPVAPKSCSGGLIR